MMLSNLIITSLFLTLTSAGPCDLNWVKRDEWGGNVVPVGGSLHPNNIIKIVFFHHTYTPECTSQEKCAARMRSMQEYHLSIGRDDLGYNFVIGGDGRVYEARGFYNDGEHTKGHNKNTISIAFIGNFMTKSPTLQMINAAKRVIECGEQQEIIHPNYGLYGQRDGTCSSGPGTYFYMQLKSWAEWHRQGELTKVC